MSDPGAGAARLLSSLDAQLTPTARHGLVILCLLLAVFGLRELSSSVTAARAEAGRIAADLALLSDDLAEPIWAQRAEEAASSRMEWQRHVWTAASEGVGAASLEMALREAARSAGLKQPQLTVTPDMLRRGEVDFLRFSLSGEMDPGTPHILLATLATSRPALFVSDLQLVLQRTGKYSVQLEGLAPFQLIQEPG